MIFIHTVSFNFLNNFRTRLFQNEKSDPDSLYCTLYNDMDAIAHCTCTTLLKTITDSCKRRTEKKLKLQRFNDFVRPIEYCIFTVTYL